MPIPAWLGYGLVSGGISGLAGFLGARAEEEGRREERAYGERIAGERRGRAKGVLADKFAPQVGTTLSQYLSGELTPAQTGILSQQRRLGMGEIGRAGATFGMPAGARAGLGVQLTRDIALRGAKLAGEQQKFGLGEWLRRKQLELQYLT